MSDACSCSCSSKPKLIFSCSGGADVGAIADQAARKLTRDGAGKMFCLAGIGGRLSGMIKSTEAADVILAIDGCPQACAKHTLLQAGFTNFQHLQMAELGMPKAETRYSDEAVARVTGKAVELLTAYAPAATD